MTNPSNKRLDYIDVAKGLAIILVVLLHLPSISKFAYFNYWGSVVMTFYMPLFFMYSGMFYKTENIYKRLKKLLIPYGSFIIIAFILYVFKSLIKNENINWSLLTAPFFGATNNYENTPLWFLLSLAEMTIIAFPICRFMNKKMAIFISFIISYVGFAIGRYYVLPYYIGTSMLCIPFITIPYNYRSLILKTWSRIIVFLLLCIMILIFLFDGKACNVSQDYIPMSYISFIIYNLAAFIVFTFISRWLCKIIIIKKILSYFGVNSLTILCTHMFLMGFVAKLLIFLNIEAALVLGLVLIMILEIPIIYFINRYIPFILGK